MSSQHFISSNKFTQNFKDITKILCIFKISLTLIFYYNLDLPSYIVNHFIIGTKVIKHFFWLSSAEHEIFSANKYENANNIWHFHIYLQTNFHAQLCLAIRKNLQFSVGW